MGLNGLIFLQVTHRLVLAMGGHVRPRKRTDTQACAQNSARSAQEPTNALATRVRRQHGSATCCSSMLRACAPAMSARRTALLADSLGRVLFDGALVDLCRRSHSNHQFNGVVVHRHGALASGRIIHTDGCEWRERSRWRCYASVLDVQRGRHRIDCQRTHLF